MKNTFVKVLSFLMALTMIVGTLGTVVVFAADCTHEDAAVIAEVKSSCTSIGYKKYHCDACGEEFIGDVVPSGAHDYKDVLPVAPTCSTSGVTAGKVCKVCNEPHPTEGPKKTNEYLDHNKSNYKVLVPSTCDEAGYYTQICLVCNNYVGTKDYAAANDPAGHKYVYDVQVEATKCISGVVNVTCSRCDYNEVIIQTEDHNYTNMPASSTDSKVPLAGTTCKYTYTKGRYCVDCYAVEPGTFELNTNADHAYVSISESFIDGSQTLANAIIDADEISKNLEAVVVDGKALGVGSKVYKAPTCTTVGWYIGYCSLCNAGKAEAERTLVAVQIPTNDEDGEHDTTGTWGAWTATINGSTVTLTNTKAEIEAGQYHNYVFKREKVCKNSGCNVVVGTEYTTATPHNFDKKNNVEYTIVHTKTCTTNGYTERTCNMGCGYKDTINLDVAKGTHNLIDNWVKDEGFNCKTNPVMIRYCQNPECDIDSNPNTKTVYSEPKTVTAVDHKYALDKVPGTCNTKSYYQEKCTECGYINPVAYDGKEVPADSANEVNGINAKNHEAKFVGGVATNVIASIPGTQNSVKNLCTDAETWYYVCICGERVELTKVAAGTHKNVTAGVTEAGGDSKQVYAVFHDVKAGCTTTDATKVVTGTCVGTCIDFESQYLPATCAATGMSAGTICTACGFVEEGKAPKETAKNPKNHVAGRTNEATVYPNCQGKGSVTWNCAGCYIKLSEEYKDSANEVVASNKNYHANMEYVAAKAASCVHDGNKAYYHCKDCDLYFETATGKDKDNNTTTVKDDIVGYVTEDANKKDLAWTVVPGEDDHSWSSTAGTFKYEKCTETGLYNYYFCNVCSAQRSKAVAVKFLDGRIVEDDPTTEDVNEAMVAVTIPAHGLEYTKNWSSLNGTATCTAGAWKDITTDVQCLFCSLMADRDTYDASNPKAVQGTTVNWVDAYAHKLDNGDDAYTLVKKENLNAAGKPIDCTLPTFEWHICSRCDEYILVGYEPAVSTNNEHTYEMKEDNSDYKTILTTPAECDKLGKKYVECTKCDYELTLEEIPMTPHHVLGGDVITFECEDYEKYKGLTCADCNVKVELDKLVHNPVNAKKAKTCTEDGFDVTYCADCTLEFAGAKAQYFKHEGHKFEKIGETATTVIYRCKECGETKEDPKAVVTNSLAATVSAETVKAGDAVAVAVKASAAKAISTLEFKVTYDASKFDLADIAVTVNAAYADKVVAFANVSGTNTVTVIVFVQNTTDGAEQTIDLTTAAELLTINFVAKKYANGESTAFTFGTAVKLNGKDETANVTASKKVKVAGFGNVNGDALISVNDVKAVQGAIGSVNADLDFNGDGIVDIDDMNLIAKFVASAQTAKDYLVMIGVYAEIEAYVADMYATGNGYDFTNDNAMNNNDIYLLLKKVDTLLGADYKSITFEGVEEIVDQAVSALLN